MGSKLKALVVAVLFLAQGCSFVPGKEYLFPNGSHWTYVESDIPGVAEYVDSVVHPQALNNSRCGDNQNYTVTDKGTRNVTVIRKTEPNGQAINKTKTIYKTNIECSPR